MSWHWRCMARCRTAAAACRAGSFDCYAVCNDLLPMPAGQGRLSRNILRHLVAAAATATHWPSSGSPVPSRPRQPPHSGPAAATAFPLDSRLVPYDSRSTICPLGSSRYRGIRVAVRLLPGRRPVDAAHPQAQLTRPVVRVAPRVSGQVAEVLVSNNGHVQPGEVLFRLDPSLSDWPCARPNWHWRKPSAPTASWMPPSPRPRPTSWPRAAAPASWTARRAAPPNWCSATMCRSRCTSRSAPRPRPPVPGSPRPRRGSAS